MTDVAPEPESSATPEAPSERPIGFAKTPSGADVPQELAKPLTPRQIAARARAKKINTRAVVVCAILSAVLGLAALFIPAGGTQTALMFASYVGVYVGVMWALAGLWAHYLGPNAPK
jgi:hypothetical protein